MAHRIKSCSRPHGTLLSDMTIRSDIPGGSTNLREKMEELQLIDEAAAKAADIFIAELKRSATEDRARTSQLISSLSAFGLNPAELSRVAKSATTDAARVRHTRRGNETEDEITWGDDVLKTAAEARAEHSLASEVRRAANKSSRLGKEIASLRKVVQTPIHLKTPQSTDITEWRAGSTQIEEKVKGLRKKLDSLRVPTQFALQKRHDECMALKAELNAAQERLKRYAGLPPSLAEAAQKLEEAKTELSSLKVELKKFNASSFGPRF